MGWCKYGCFGVYDTDAKRVFNSVKVDDVYTHTCAKEMAVGLLKNSNATLAISVTGKCYALFSDLEKPRRSIYRCCKLWKKMSMEN